MQGAYDASEYAGDKFPARSDVISTRNAARLQKNAGSPAFLLELADMAVENFLDMLGDTTGIDLTLLADLFDAFTDLFGWVAGEPLDPVSAAIRFLELAVQAGVSIPVGLVGGLREWFQRLIPTMRFPVAALTTAPGGLLQNPDFEGAASIYDPLGRFKYDGAVSYNDVGGSARVDCDGTLYQLETDPPTPVNPGDELTFGIMVRWVDLVAANDSIQLVVIGYDIDDEQISETVAASISAPGTTSIGRAGANAQGWLLLTGTYTVDEDDTVTDHITQMLVVRETSSAGHVWWDHGTQEKEALIRANWVAGLIDGLQDSIGRYRAIINAATNSLRRTEDFDYELGDFAVALTEIPWEHLLPVGGGLNLGESLMNTWNQIVGGFVGQPGTGATPPDLFNLSRWVSSGSFLGRAAADILGRRTNRSLNGGMLSTSKATLPLSLVATGTPESFAVTQAATALAWEVLEEDQPIGVVRWRGSGNLNLTAAYINIWKMNRDTGFRELVHRSGNIVGDLPSLVDVEDSPIINYQLPAEERIAGLAGECYGFEIEVKGTGSHTVIGALVWTNNDPDAHPKNFASTRDAGTGAPPETMLATDDYTANVPYVEYGIAMAGKDVHLPREDNLTQPGTYQVPIASWADEIDVVLLPGGGDGAGGTLLFYGDGGHVGPWLGKTFKRGVDYDENTAYLDITVGGRKQASSVTIEEATFSTPAGANGAGLLPPFARTVGRGPKSFTFNGIPYMGGADQMGAGAAGNAPGGGGAGGNILPFSKGGAGAGGSAWVLQRDVVNEEGDPDTGTPTAPTVELVEATPATLKVRAFGATDTSSEVVAHDFFRDGTQVNVQPVPVADGESVFLIEGLTATTEFAITAKAINTAGVRGPASDPVAMLTLPPVPSLEDPDLTAEQWTEIDAIVNSEFAGMYRGITISISGPNGKGAKSYGSAGTRPLATDDHFRMGSVTKSFVATKALQLIGAEELAFTDKVSQYVQGIPNGDLIEITHLFNMRSGIPDYGLAFQMNFLFNPSAAISFDSIMAQIRGSTPLFAPGAGYSYSNSNTILLGLVIEAITEQSVKDAVMADVVAQVEMVETSWPDNYPMFAPYTHGYGANPQRQIPILGWFAPVHSDQTNWQVPQLTRAAGTLVTTIGDLHRWAQELRDGTLITEALQFARENPPPEWEVPYTGPLGPDKFYYGYNTFHLGGWNGGDGSVPGYDCCAMYERSTGAIICVMGNFQTPGLNSLTRIHHRLADYLYPGSANNPEYGIKPTDANVVGTGNVSARTVVETSSTVAGVGNVDADVTGDDVFSVWSTDAITTAQADIVAEVRAELAALADGTGTASGVATRRVDVENVNVSDEAIPDNVTGCWVTLIGAGGGGYYGGWTINQSGGPGGGGGAKINRVWIPVEDLGETYSLTRGLGGAQTVAGTASVFTSGGITLTAGGGGYGGGVGGWDQTVYGGAGGTWSATGISGVTGVNGSAGGNSHMYGGSAGANNTGGAGAGGGGGGGNVNNATGGGNGGNSATRAGSGTNSGTAPTAADPGNGGAGGGGGWGGGGYQGPGGNGAPGGLYGGGGGGGGCSWDGNNGDGAAGADGYTLVEWAVAE